MLPLLHIASLAAAAGMIRSDLRTRRVDARVLALFASVNLVLGGWLCGGPAGWAWAAGQLAANLLLLALFYAALWGWTAVIRRGAIGSLTAAIGAGDLLFLPALAPLFETREFAAFLTASFAASLVGVGVCRLAGRRVASVPLVATVGVCFVAYTLYRILR